MAGLFLNFFKINIENQEFDLSSVSFADYSSKESYFALQDKYPDFQFYRVNDKIFYWHKKGEPIILPLNSSKSRINLLDNPKIVSKIIESCLLYKLQSDDRLEVKRLSHSYSWDVLSSNNILNGIDGLAAYNCYNITPRFIRKNDNVFLGFTISLKTKFKFIKDRQSLEANGFDTIGLKGDENEIFANTPAAKRYVEAMGYSAVYDNFKKNHFNNKKNYEGIIKFIDWLNWNVLPTVKIPNGDQLKSLTYYNIPSTEFNHQVLRRPKRFFYSGQEDTKNLTYYNQKVKEYKPASFDEIDSIVQIGVICPKKHEGRTETFLKTVKNRLETELHIKQVNFVTKFIEDERLGSYSEVLYDDALQKSKAVIIVVNEDQKIIPVKQSPYYYCKAKLIGNGIPTQLIRVETINAGVNSFAMTNLTLNIYAKIGGTAWTIEKEDKLKKEFIIGIGSTTLDDGKHVLGLAQIFDPDGRYLVGDCAPVSTFDNYKENLKSFLKKIIQDEIESASISGSEEFRLIFHIYKSPSSEYELAAVKEVIDLFSKYSFTFALIHLAYGHNYRLFYAEGTQKVSRGLYLPIDDYEALLNFVPQSNLPLKIKLDGRSTFQDLQYLSQQVYWFSDLSHRSYMPAKRTVTLMYPSLMVALTEKLKEVDGWDFDRLKHINDKLWFI
jgi:Piwi domain